MAETSSSTTVSTKLERIAKLAREMPQAALTTLAHHIDIDWLREAYRRTRKDGATGIDRQTAAEYARKLDENLRSLLERAKSGSYVAPLVEERVKEQLRRQFVILDPIALLKAIRDTQQELAACDAGSQPRARLTDDLGAFLDGLATAWQKIDRPPRGRRKSATHWWRTRIDPFTHTCDFVNPAWPTLII
jgi:hypothetical protein